jgi:Ca2+-transporting ATPase
MLIGFVALIDPPRIEAKQAIKDTITAGIKPVMITGDHQNTAMAIGKEVGIYHEGDICLTGEELDKLKDDEISKVINKVSIYARVSPEHKIKIVKAWQNNSGIVAFVGDGINDAPAIRQANIGIAMGRSGTEVSKDASSIILTDDNYSTIIKAVRNGRKIYNNIQNAILFLISGNAAGIFLVIYTSILSLPIPFAPVHLLFINLLTDSLPAIAIGMEESDEDLLSKPPRKINQSLLSNHVLKIILFEGFLLGLFTMLSYYIGLQTSSYVARTLVFGTLCIARLFHSFNCRGTKSIFKNKIKNKSMIFSFILGMILINLVLFFKPLQAIFHTYTLTNVQIFFMYFNAIMPTVFIQIILLIRQQNYKSKK